MTCVRFSFVEICTDSGSLRHAASFGSRSGTARMKLPPRPTNALTLPRCIASQTSTVFIRDRWWEKPYCSANRSSGASSGFSVMPTVRWP